MDGNFVWTELTLPRCLYVPSAGNTPNNNLNQTQNKDNFKYIQYDMDVDDNNVIIKHTFFYHF